MFDSLSRDVSTPDKLIAYVVSQGVADRLPDVGIDYAARVTAGVTHLDAVAPTWWSTAHVHPIDLDDLDISNGAWCVSAQLSGKAPHSFAFVEGRDMLGLTTGSRGTYVLYGFLAESDHDLLVRDYPNYDQDEAHDLLTALWQNVIRVRRGEPVELRTY